MAKYLSSKLKIIKKFGLIPTFTSKKLKLKKKLSNFADVFINDSLKSNQVSSDYFNCLFEKQKLRYTYSLSDHQLFLYYKKIKNKQGSKIINLLKILESRLDVVLFRFALVKSIVHARQLINHSHILINTKKMNFSNYLCKSNDIITLKNTNLIQFSSNLKNYNWSHLFFDWNNLTGIYLNPINTDELNLNINLIKVLEFYS